MEIKTNVLVSCSAVHVCLFACLPDKFGTRWGTFDPRFNLMLKKTFFPVCRNLGVENQLLLFEFATFKIAVRMIVNVIDPRQMELTPNTPFERPSRSEQHYAGKPEGERWTVYGQKPNIR